MRDKKRLAFALLLLSLIFVPPAFSEDAGEDADSSETLLQTGKKAVAIKKGKIRLPDGVIVKNLGEAFAASKTVNPRAIKASVKNGEVTLRGKVGTVSERNLIDAIVRTSPGVQNVRNSLRVEKARKEPWPRHDPRGIADVLHDEKTLKKVRQKLARSGLVRMADVKIVVYMGVVVIAGPVETEAARKKIRETVLYTEKVRAVVNNTWVRPEYVK